MRTETVDPKPQRAPVSGAWTVKAALLEAHTRCVSEIKTSAEPVIGTGSTLLNSVTTSLTSIPQEMILNLALY